MHIDARQLPPGSTIATDLCIVGGGAAGITIARELAHARTRVCLIEAGGLEPDSTSDHAQDVVVVGRNYDAATQVRTLGGNTHLWGGHCVPLRAINFQKAPWSPWSGWPIDLDALMPYYRRAHEHLDLGPVDYEPTATAATLGLDLFPLDPSRVETVMSRYRPLRFGPAYGHELVTSPYITLYAHARATSINRAPNQDFIRSVTVKTTTGVTSTVVAKHYVLATGGIENARLLLASNQVQPEGLGNHNDLVGRFFMEHIWLEQGSITPRGSQPPLLAYGQETRLTDALAVRFHLALPEAVVTQSAIPDFRTEIEIVPLDTEHHRFEYRLLNFIEQAPNPSSRVTLSPEFDQFGVPRVALDWRLSEIDRVGLERAHELIADEVRRSGFGSMDLGQHSDHSEVLPGADGGCHHMGTTRMHEDATHGVVDANCRIHGLQNISVAGSSVFPTVGYANPTLTIIALAIRLADHLRPALRLS